MHKAEKAIIYKGFGLCIKWLTSIVGWGIITKEGSKVDKSGDKSVVAVDNF